MTSLHSTATHSTRPPTRRRRVGAVLGALALVATVSACDGDDDVDEAVDDIEQGVDDVTGEVAAAIEEVGEDTVELAARNLANTHAKDEFADAGYEIDGDLTCTASATEDLTAVEIDCTGATEDGEVVSMTGTTTELPGASVTELEGDFVGFVDDEQVFQTDALG